MHSYFLYKEYLINKNEELIEEARKNILLCIENADKIKPEFVDTYFLILEEMGDTKTIENELNKYNLLFPDSEVIEKWIKKY